METKRFFVFFFSFISSVAFYAQNYEPGEVTARRYEVTKALDVAPDNRLMDILAPYKQVVDSIMSPVIGESEVYMKAERPESPLSNFVADVLREASVRVGKKADIGLCNIGGLRSAMPKGKVTYGDILEISPFENKLCVLTMRGSDVQKLMQQIAAVGGEGISGANLVISKDGSLMTATVGGKLIDDNSMYTIATLDYLSEGNDKLYALKDHLFIKNTDFSVRDLIIESVSRAYAEGRKISAKVEGRIVKQ